MKRKKRLTIFRVAIGLAAVAAIIPVTALAKPTPADQLYVGHRSDVDVVVLGSDDRSFSKAAPESQGGVVQSPDDRSFSKATSVDPTPVVADSNNGVDVGMGAATGFLLVLLAVTGGAFIIRHNRKAKLSPA